MSKAKKTRTSSGLRDILFDELEGLRAGSTDPTRALAVANLAKQIINVAKVELDYHREVAKQTEKGISIPMGQMQLGNAPVADTDATEH